VPFALGRLQGRLVTSPSLIAAVLDSEAWPPLSRGRMAAADRWYSGGLILTEGVEHHRQRDELWRPLVADRALLDLAVRRAERRAGRWEAGRPLDLFVELRALTAGIDWEALTSGDLDETPALLEAQDRGAAALVWLLGPFGEGRWNAPLPGSARARAARRRLDEALGRAIAERRGGDGDDLLAQLTRTGASDELICATAKQWLGADQLYAALAWTFQLLAEHPEIEARWHAELDGALNGAPPGPGQLSALPYTRMVFQEALRLYPPIWGFFRQVTDDFELGGETVPAGGLIALSPWYTHRDPRLWPDPLRFDPERWSEGAERPPRVSYFPFSDGPYGCPAHDLATAEAVLVLAALGRRFAFRPARSRPPKPVATGIVAPKGGLPMVPQAR
jgi:cytochrome P450